MRTKIKGKHSEIIIPELEKLSKEYISQFWTPKEEQILLRYGHLPVKELIKYFPNRSMNAIRNKYYKLRSEENAN